jgi:hypothetical protein
MGMVLGPVRKKADVMAEQRAERQNRQQDDASADPAPEESQIP